MTWWVSVITVMGMAVIALAIADSIQRKRAIDKIERDEQGRKEYGNFDDSGDSF